MATPLRPGTFLFSEALSTLSASSVWVSEASLPFGVTSDSDGKYAGA